MSVDELAEGLNEDPADASSEINGLDVFAVSPPLAVLLFGVIVVRISQLTSSRRTTSPAGWGSTQEKLFEHR
jgi:hypothetical protein